MTVIHVVRNIICVRTIGTVSNVEVLSTTVQFYQFYERPFYEIRRISDIQNFFTTG